MLNPLLRNYLYLRPNESKNNKQFANVVSQWLFDAYDIKKSGIPGFYHLKNGYSPSYPETTGYLIPSLFRTYKTFTSIGQKIPLDNLIHYLLTIQNQDGGWGHIDDYFESMIFDTAQILEGLYYFIEKNHKLDTKIIDSVYRGIRFITLNQNSDGSINERWIIKKCYGYQARTFSAMMKIGFSLDDHRIIEGAERGINYILKTQKSNGWFRNCANMISADKPITHFLAYTIEGMLKCGLMLDNLTLINSAKISLDQVNRSFDMNKNLYLSFNCNWKSVGRSSILTGLSQFAILNWHLYRYTNEPHYMDRALSMNKLVKNTIVFSNTKAINGGIQSCFPFSGKYYKYCYLNWASKFFLDAIYLEELSSQKILYDEFDRIENI